MELLQLLLYYLLNAGNFDNVNEFIKGSAKTLAPPVRGELMTAAEKLIAQGMEKGRAEGREDRCC